MSIDPASGQPQGIFRAANVLVEDGDLSDEDKIYIVDLFDWFNENLPVPDSRHITDKAIFWFLSSATTCVEKMWHLTNILRSHGCEVEVRICRTLYNICYRDSYQVAASPSPNNSKVMIK